jgi:hypothetical protein
VATSIAPAADCNTRDWTARRRTAPKTVIDNLSRIPGVGPSLAADLFLVGIREVAELRGRNPETLYRDLCSQVGATVDRCVLYVFRCAVYYASEDRPDAEKLKWWNWKDSR